MLSAGRAAWCTGVCSVCVLVVVLVVVLAVLAVVCACVDVVVVERLLQWRNVSLSLPPLLSAPVGGWAISQLSACLACCSMSVLPDVVRAHNGCWLSAQSLSSSQTVQFCCMCAVLGCTTRHIVPPAPRNPLLASLCSAQ